MATKLKGALVKLNMSHNNFYETEAGKALGDMLAANTVLKELDVSKCAMQNPESVEAFAHGLSANGALASVNILANDIGGEQANALIEILKSKDTLKTLCGFSGNETELDLSGKRLSAGCGVLVANEVRDNGALTSLNISDNKIVRMQYGNGKWISDMSGVKALAAAIPQCK